MRHPLQVALPFLRLRAFAPLLATVALLSGLTIACGGAGGGSSFGMDGGDGGGQDGTISKVDGGRARDGKSDVPSLGNGKGNIVSIAITPKAPKILVVNGALPAPTAFQVLGTTKQGTTTAVANGVWSFDSPDLGSVDGSGKFTPSGLVGGVGNLKVVADSLSATTTVTVVLQMTFDPSNLGATLGPKFAAATAIDAQLALDYPYDQTVFPRGLPGPVAQWCLGPAPTCTGNATDVYHIKVTGPTATFEAFTTTATPSAPSFAFPTTPVDVWSKLTSSTAGALTFSIARYDGTEAYVARTETWNIASATFPLMKYGN